MGKRESASSRVNYIIPILSLRKYDGESSLQSARGEESVLEVRIGLGYLLFGRLDGDPSRSLVISFCY